MAGFRHRLRVAFGDVDHANIVYYPRFFHYFHLALEELLFTAFEASGGYRSLLDQRRLGLPTVHAECDFSRPLRFGDEIEVGLAVDRIGRSSIVLRTAIKKVHGGELCAEGRVTCAVVDLTTFRSVKVPDDLVAVFEPLRFGGTW